MVIPSLWDKFPSLINHKFINTSHIFFLQTCVGKSRHRILHGNIDALRADIDPFINYDFDPDIDQLKIEANGILNELARIEQEIP